MRNKTLIVFHQARRRFDPESPGGLEELEELVREDRRLTQIVMYEQIVTAALSYINTNVFDVLIIGNT